MLVYLDRLVSGSRLTNTIDFLDQHFRIIKGDNGMASSLDALLGTIEIANIR